MPLDDDLYQLLGVSPDATPSEIKEAYFYKVNILHPDRLAAMSPRYRERAEEELKRVNAAYEVLSSPSKRRQYDGSRNRVIHTQNAPRTSPERPDSSPGAPVKPPKPEVYPKTVTFNNAPTYVPQKGSFFVRNAGGPYGKVLISTPPEWLRMVKTVPLQDGSKLPMRVDIEGVGIQWGKTYSADIIISLDGRETKVKAKLKTRKKPR